MGSLMGHIVNKTLVGGSGKNQKPHQPSEALVTRVIPCTHVRSRVHSRNLQFSSGIIIIAQPWLVSNS